MKVRVRHSTLGPWYIVEVWRWWWPFWRYAPHSACHSFKEAKEIADLIKNPTILEVE